MGFLATQAVREAAARAAARHWRVSLGPPLLVPTLSLGGNLAAVRQIERFPSCRVSQ